MLNAFFSAISFEASSETKQELFESNEFRSQWEFVEKNRKMISPYILTEMELLRN